MGRYTADGRRRSSMKHAAYGYRCSCGREVSGNGGKSGHRRKCEGRWLSYSEAFAARAAEWEAEQHGGGRFIGLRPGEPGTQRLVADFYEQANRDLFAFIETNLRDLLRLAESATPTSTEASDR